MIPTEISRLSSQYMPVHENECIQSHFLSRCSHIAIQSQKIEKLANLTLAHLRRVFHFMVANVVFDPIKVSLLGFNTIVPRPDSVPD